MTSVAAELFHREHEAHDARIDTHFSRTSHFASDDDGFCRSCGRPACDHYDERCPIVGIEEAIS